MTVDASNAVTATNTVTVGTQPTGVALTSTRAYVANQRSNNVSVIDLTQSPPAVIATIPVGSAPDAAALSADASRLYVPNFSGGTLSIISTSTNTVTNTVAIGKDPDGTIEVGGLVYVANLLSSTISVVDPSSGTVTRTISLPATVAPSGLAASADGHTLYANDDRNGRTYPIDLTQNPPVVGAPATIGASTYPAYLSVAGTTGYVAASGANKVAVLDLSQNPPVVTGSVPVGTRDYGVFAVPALGEVFATNSGSNTVSVIDTSSSPGTVVSSVPTGTTPDAIAVSPDNSTAIVSNEGAGTVSLYHVNQAPVNTVPGAQTVISGQSLTFSNATSNQISTADSDAGSNPVQITLSVGHGTLTLSGTSGLTFTSGSNGSGSMQFTGTLTDVNNALNGLMYQPTNGYQGADTLSVTDNDQGHTGLGKPQASTSTVGITVSGNPPPTVGNESYSGAIGNTTFGVGTTPSSPSTHTSGTVLSNSSDSDGDTLTAVPGSISTANGGTVTMNSDGTFTYQPPVGFTGSDSFIFQVSDGHSTSSGTATVAVANRVWYVNDNAATNGNGTSTSPFNSLAPVNPASSSGDYIFVYGSSTPYGGGIVLKGSQTLVGQSYGLTISGATVVPASGSNPTITNAGGIGVTLAEGDKVDGITVSSTTGAGMSASGVNDFTLDPSDSISNTTGDGLDVNGGNGTVSNGATISTSSAHALSIQNRTGGTITNAGAITDDGQGIALSSNAGSIVNFTGTISASTGTSTAFSATGGGTVNATGAGSTLSTTTGTALTVSGTTIGSSNLTFQSISANGGANGIVLANTGSSGGLNVTGNGAAGSGGSIQGIAGGDASTANCGNVGSGIPAGIGVYLDNTTAPSLAYMNLPGTFGNFGILGYGVSGFTLDHTTMNGTYGNNAAQYESAVMFCGLTGSAGVTNDSISGGRMGNFTLINTSGTLNRLTMTGDTFGLNNGNDGNDSVQLLPYNAGTVLNATVEDSTFMGARAVPFSFEPQSGASSDLVFGQPGHGNVVHNTIASPVGAGQDLQYTPDGPATFDINSNTFDVSSPSNSTAEGGVLINASESQANAQGYFRNNTTGNPSVNDSGTTGGMPALDMESNGGGILTVGATNNHIYQFNSVANGAVELIGSSSGATAGSIFNVTFTGNTIANPGTYNKAQVSAGGTNATGFHLDSGTLSTDAFTMCLDFAGNTLNGSGDGAPAGDARFRQRFNTKVNMPGYSTGPGSSGVPAYIQGLNPVGPPAVTAVSSTSTGGGFFNASCTTPTFP